MLHSGAVLPAHRGRGSTGRWSPNACVTAGTVARVTRAGHHSRPILERVGFQPIGFLVFLVDRWS